jgi:signal transduction histidine kinase
VESVSTALHPGVEARGRVVCQTAAVTTPAPTSPAPRGWRRVVQRERHDSGIPVDTDWDAALTAVYPLITLALVILCLVTVHPLGWSGWGLVGVVLIAVNGLLMVTRTLPDALVDDRVRLALALAAAVAAGLLWGFDSASWAESFGYTLAVHAGTRFEARVATAVAGLSALTAVVTSVLRTDDSGQAPWWLGATILLAVAGGMLRRSRRRGLASAHELVVQSRRAAASETKAQVLADRTELARDLHDVLAHSLSGVNMQLSMANALFEAGRDDDGQDAVRRAQGMVVDGLAEARRAVSMLRTGALDLVPTLQAMVTGESESLRFDAGATGVDGPTTLVVVRVAQEALTNARRHAPGARVGVCLDADPGSVRLDIANAAPPVVVTAQGEGSGLGLVGMRERGASVGASLEAGPVTEGEYAGGWRVLLVVPRREEQK